MTGSRDRDRQVDRPTMTTRTTGTHERTRLEGRATSVALAATR
jgi:hypothetical protein